MCSDEPPPITVNGSPYSDDVQLVEIATRTPPEVQLRLLAWWTPKLWPSSWATTRSENALLFQLSDPGIWPSPAQPHDATYGNA